MELIAFAVFLTVVGFPVWLGCSYSGAESYSGCWGSSRGLCSLYDEVSQTNSVS